MGDDAGLGVGGPGSGINCPVCLAGQGCCAHGKCQIEKWRQAAADGASESAIVTAARAVALTAPDTAIANALRCSDKPVQGKTIMVVPRKGKGALQFFQI